MWAGGGNTIFEHKVVVVQWEEKVVLDENIVVSKVKGTYFSGVPRYEISQRFHAFKGTSAAERLILTKRKDTNNNIRLNKKESLNGSEINIEILRVKGWTVTDVNFQE